MASDAAIADWVSSFSKADFADELCYTNLVNPSRDAIPCG